MSYEIPNGATFELCYRCLRFPGTGTINVAVKSLTGKTTHHTVELTRTILSVKREIYYMEGIPLDQQRHIFAGVQLHDERKLWTYGLSEGVTIGMVLRMRGD